MSAPTHRADTRPRIWRRTAIAAILTALVAGYQWSPLGSSREDAQATGALGVEVASAPLVVESRVELADRFTVESRQWRQARAAAKAVRDARQAALERRRERRRERQAASAPLTVRIGSFNVLGSQHTAPGGARRGFASGASRSAGTGNLVAKHQVDILGTQELQEDQLRALQARTGMAAYPGFAWGSAETDNSILWDPSRFELVSGDRFVIPLMGRPRPQPIVRLRDRATGREFYVINTHPSAHGGRYLLERRSGQAALVDVIDRLREDDLTVLVTGDMNDREEFFCRVVAEAGLSAANGGSHAGGCRPPPGPVPVDWVVGSSDVTWSGYWRDTSPVTNRTSDHFFISATANVS